MTSASDCKAKKSTVCSTRLVWMNLLAFGWNLWPPFEANIYSRIQLTLLQAFRVSPVACKDPSVWCLCLCNVCLDRATGFFILIFRWNCINKFTCIYDSWGPNKCSSLHVADCSVSLPSRVLYKWLEVGGYVSFFLLMEG